MTQGAGIRGSGSDIRSTCLAILPIGKLILLGSAILLPPHVAPDRMDPFCSPPPLRVNGCLPP